MKGCRVAFISLDTVLALYCDCPISGHDLLSCLCELMEQNIMTGVYIKMMAIIF
jgi:hypothetical protein